MNGEWVVVILIVLSLFVVQPSTAQESDADSSHSRIELRSHSGQVKVRLGAEFNFDYLGFDRGEQSIPGVGAQENDFMVKRGRIYLAGSLHRQIDFKIKAGLELEGTPLIDAYAALHLPWGIDVRAGQLKVPFSEERLRSFSRQPFMERGLAHGLALRRSQGVYFSGRPGRGGVRVDLGTVTGESLHEHSTDDEFEYVGRVALVLDQIFAGFPGAGAVRAAAARGGRRPERGPTNSFFGKTMNGLEFFTPVPVSGLRTRYEADVEFQRRWLWVAAEWMGVEEERNGVAVRLDTDGDGIADDSVVRDLNPLLERGWMAYAVFMLTGEDADDWVVPKRRSGALSLALRYSTVVFDSQQDRIRAGTPGLSGVEVSDASEALGRPNIDESVNDLYVGLNWYVASGVFVQTAAVWQWFEYSSPYGGGDRSDVNYRARMGVVF